MDLRHLREFITCAKVGNFTKAADMLYVTQPVLSKHIYRLEQEVGAKLFLRANPLVLTKAGAYLLAKIEPLVQQCETIFLEAAALDKGYAGSLGFGILYYTKEVIMPAIAQFTQTYPDINLRYHFGTPYEILSAVVKRTIDLACLQRVPISNHEALEFHALYPEPFVLICSLEHRLARKKKIRLKEVKAEKYIQVDDEFYAGFLQNINAGAGAHGVRFEPSIYVKNFEELLTAIRLNQGVSIVAEAIVKVDLGLKYVRFVEPDLHFIRSLVYRRDNDNPNLSLFLQALA